MTSTVRVRVILPLAVAMILLVAMFISIFIIETRWHQSEELARTASSFENLFQRQFTERARLMQSVMELVLRDRNLESALRSRDRQALFDLSAPILEVIRDASSITHFYYILPDRTMLLRVARPDQHGDRIDRFGLQEAQRTGKPFWGYEQGALGSITLRVTYPWYSNGEVIGYLEMGADFESIIHDTQKQFNVDIFVAVYKRFLDQGELEALKEQIGYQVDWGEFPSVVVLSRTRPEIPAPIAAYLAVPREQPHRHTFMATWDEQIAHAVVLPLTDVRGRQLGEIIVLYDITATTSERRWALLWVVVAGSMIGGILIVFFYVLLGRVLQDVTDRRQAEMEVRLLNESLEQKIKELVEVQEDLVRKEKLAVLGQVVGSVGHELRNPLGVMNNAVYFLQTVLADADETTREYLGIIRNEIAVSDRIVSDLLDSVRTKPSHPETIGVRTLIEQALRKCTVPPSIAVGMDIPETVPPLRVDGMQIHQVFRNLIANGIDAMPEGGTLTIRAAECPEADAVAIEVRDTGIGMTPEQLALLFQPLFTTKARGIGLGLVVVKNLTEANGGRVEVESEAGKGTTFRVTLPRDAPAGDMA